MISPHSAPPIYVARQTLPWSRARSREGRLKKGLCGACYGREFLHRRHFACFRLWVIAHDHGAGRVSYRPESARRIHVHHRRPGVSKSNARLLIILGPGRHALAPGLKVADPIQPESLRDQWRGQHPEASELPALDFNRARDFTHPPPPIPGGSG